MFAAGSTEIGHVDVPKNKEAEERRGSSFVRSAFTDRELELEMLASMPDAEEAPPPLLPPGWEQRLDQRSGKIFYVDHNTCTTQWVDPRSESALSESNRSVFSDGSASCLSFLNVNGNERSVNGNEPSLNLPRSRGDRPGSPNSASARSAASAGELSSISVTTASTCREALASLRLLAAAQQLDGYATVTADAAGPSVAAGRSVAAGGTGGLQLFVTCARLPLRREGRQRVVRLPL